MQRRPQSHELPLFRVPADRPDDRGPSEDEAPLVLSVGELDRRLKRLVEGATSDVHVEGEIAGLKLPGSGHAYFSLKDEHEEATIDCVMYRTAPLRSHKLLTDGARVVLIGRATVYTPRGKLQLVAEQARPAGRGALLEALERLKARLAGEGLFAPERKRRLPAEARVIGVVTSGDGAAIHDIMKVAFRRGRVRIVLAPAPVQGASAGPLLARAVGMLARVLEVEVIIVGRGGGSVDDLSAFNDETLVRAVAACRVPVVSAVGHEVDVTLIDLVADARASTPSQAAELVVPDAVARHEELQHLRVRMRRAVSHGVAAARAELDRGRARLGTPDRLLAEPRQRVDDARRRLVAALRRAAGEGRGEVTRLSQRLYARHPRAVLAGGRAELGPLLVRLSAAMRRRLMVLRDEVAADAARLDALSPLAVLGRGYAIVAGPAGRAVLDAAEVRPGEEVRVRVHRGAFAARVVAVDDDSSAHDEQRRRMPR